VTFLAIGDQLVALGLGLIIGEPAPMVRRAA